MKVKELVGSRVCVEVSFGPKVYGRISSMPMTVELETIQASVNASTFRLELGSGDTIQTSGINISPIDDEGYVKEWAESGDAATE